jgi:hypothetical protein
MKEDVRSLRACRIASAWAGVPFRFALMRFSPNHCEERLNDHPILYHP